MHMIVAYQEARWVFFIIILFYFQTTLLLVETNATNTNASTTKNKGTIA